VIDQSERERKKERERGRETVLTPVDNSTRIIAGKSKKSNASDDQEKVQQAVRDHGYTWSLHRPNLHSPPTHPPAIVLAFPESSRAGKNNRRAKPANRGIAYDTSCDNSSISISQALTHLGMHDQSLPLLHSLTLPLSLSKLSSVELDLLTKSNKVAFTVQKWALLLFRAPSFGHAR
jgi:hypothetical protein